MNQTKDTLTAFILTHGRPNNVKTLQTLKRCGFTGKYYLIVDDEDSKKDDYLSKYGDKVILFNKTEIAKTFDEGDQGKDRRAVIYARNACFEIAEKLGIKYFIQLDDDYTNFSYRFDPDLKYRHKSIKNLDKIFSIMLDYYKSIPAVTLAMAQSGDFIGGKSGGFGKEIRTKRKAMNSFICSTDRKFKFIGRVNEDVNTYVNLGSRGLIFLTINNVSLNQETTQKNSGGMSELYLDSGTYQKSFFTVMFAPSCVIITEMGSKYKRLHHQIDWGKAVPKILSESVKKVN